MRHFLLIAAALGALTTGAMAADRAFRPLDQWRPYGGNGPLPPQWQIAGGVIAHTPGGGDIVSVETFRDFELDFDWKISPGGNSGVMYRVDERDGAPFQSGPEYQIIDNAAHIDGLVPITSAASCYGIAAPSADFTRPAGEWNSGRIIVNGNHVEHWLNGHKVVEYELGSPQWKTAVAASKFAAWPVYGTRPEGHIDLQDHGNDVAFRNLMVKSLDP